MRKVAGLLALVLFGSVAWAASQVTQGAAVEEDFSFALVADVQYAAKPDSGLRRYATSIDRLREAVVDWSDEDLDFTVQLGDIIDGADSPEASMGDLNRVLSVFADAPQPLRHVVGNHCLEVTRASLEERLPLSPTWYSFRRGIWRFVVVDSLWMGLPGRSPEEPRAVAAQHYLDKHTESKQSRPYNGALGPDQRAWLADELEAAESAGEHVVIFSHLPVLADSAHPSTILWDHADVLAILERSPAFSAWIAGHCHSGGYAEVAGRHFLTLRGMVEAPEGTNSYAVVHAEGDTLVIDGRGQATDRRLTMSSEPLEPGALLALASEESHPALTEYRGRTIARTMHWRGAEWLLRKSREDEEAPAQLMRALSISPGDSVVDFGCGNGFHSLRFAEAVGGDGRVLGVDIQPEMLEMLEVRAKQAGIDNVIPVQASTFDPGLWPASADLIVMVDVYHELDRPTLILERARRALRDGGRLALVEFRSEDESVPIKPRHKMSAAQVIDELSANGFFLDERYDELPWQHLLIFKAAW